MALAPIQWTCMDSIEMCRERHNVEILESLWFFLILNPINLIMMGKLVYMLVTMLIQSRMICELMCGVYKLLYLAHIAQTLKVIRKFGIVYDNKEKKNETTLIPLEFKQHFFQPSTWTL